MQLDVVRTNTAARWAASISSRVRWARRSVVPPVDSLRGARRSLAGYASDHGRIYSQIQWHRPSLRRRSPSWTCSNATARCASNSTRTPATSADKMTERGFRPQAGRAPDHPGHARRCPAGDDDGRQTAQSVAFTSSAFSFPVVPEGQARIRTQMSAGLTPRTARSGGRGIY